MGKIAKSDKSIAFCHHCGFIFEKRKPVRCPQCHHNLDGQLPETFTTQRKPILKIIVYSLITLISLSALSAGILASYIYRHDLREHAAINQLTPYATLLTQSPNQPHFNNQLAKYNLPLPNTATALIINPDTTLTNEQLTTLRRLKNLGTLILNNTRVSDPTLNYIAALNQLHTLQLMNTDITDHSLAKITRLKNLQTLMLANTDVANQSLADITTHHNLKLLILSQTGIKGQSLVQLKNLTNLEILALGNFTFPTDGPAHTQLKSLANKSPAEQYIHAATTYTLLNQRQMWIEDQHLAHLTQLPNLKWLCLAGLPITDTGLMHLAPLDNLQVLDLRNTRVSTKGITQFQTARKSPVNTILTAKP